MLNENELRFFSYSDQKHKMVKRTLQLILYSQRCIPHEVTVEHTRTYSVEYLLHQAGVRGQEQRTEPSLRSADFVDVQLICRLRTKRHSLVDQLSHGCATHRHLASGSFLSFFLFLRGGSRSGQGHVFHFTLFFSVVQFSSVQFSPMTIWVGVGGDTKDDSEEIVFQSSVQEFIVNSSGRGR